jgi:hypothetical protein
MTDEKKPSELPWEIIPTWHDDTRAYSYHVKISESAARKLSEGGNRILHHFEWAYEENDDSEVVSVPFDRRYLKQLIDLLRSALEGKN